MNSAWRKLSPDCVPERNFEGFETATSAAAVEEIAMVDDISMGKTMGLNVDSEDIGVLVEDHRAELTTEELIHLQNEQQKTLAEEMTSGEEERKEDVPSYLIKAICAKWGDVQNFVEKYDLDTVVANRAVNFSMTMSCLILENFYNAGKKQLTLDRFLLGRKKRNPRERFT
ncbi:uncharacterized protein LOC118762892 [Octopus sinensis]|uniref:Uncharacterized protein LOC118762892 n=1 Tax=Octopus sinensis TaxID=2607531 RepID=A0A7E6ESN9_9MOLL|nr:uncharacterized protein LOC118762892 [Octopus sinensis]